MPYSETRQAQLHSAAGAWSNNHEALSSRCWHLFLLLIIFPNLLIFGPHCKILTPCCRWILMASLELKIVSLLLSPLLLDLVHLCMTASRPKMGGLGCTGFRRLVGHHSICTEAHDVNRMFLLAPCGHVGGDDGFGAPQEACLAREVARSLTPQQHLQHMSCTVSEASANIIANSSMMLCKAGRNIQKRPLLPHTTWRVYAAVHAFDKCTGLGSTSSHAEHAIIHADL